jgi:hypothetical protein
LGSWGLIFWQAFFDSFDQNPSGGVVSFLPKTVKSFYGGTNPPDFLSFAEKTKRFQKLKNIDFFGSWEVEGTSVATPISGDINHSNICQPASSTSVSTCFHSCQEFKIDINHSIGM